MNSEQKTLDVGVERFIKVLFSDCAERGEFSDDHECAMPFIRVEFVLYCSLGFQAFTRKSLPPMVYSTSSCK